MKACRGRGIAGVCVLFAGAAQAAGSGSIRARNACHVACPSTGPITSIPRKPVANATNTSSTIKTGWGDSWGMDSR